MIDSTNPVVAMCVEGMALEGTPAQAKLRFEAAWEARTDDYDAAIAAHYLARHQDTPLATLHWNQVALRHARAVTDGRASTFLPSLHLNLAAAHANLGEREPAKAALQQAAVHLSARPPGGYRNLLALGIRRLGVQLHIDVHIAADT